MTNISKLNLQKGAAMMTVVAMSMFIGLLISHGVTSPTVRDIKNTDDFYNSKKSFYTAESAEEDVRHRARTGMSYDEIEVFNLNGAFATTTTFSNAQTGRLELTTVSDKENLFRKKYTELIESSGASFFYGAQTDAGGLLLRQFSWVNGNVYSNGPITGSGNDIWGDAISAGPNGLVSDVTVTGDVRANSIEDASIEGDAYYQTISGSTVLGTLYPESEDEPEEGLPISDSTLDFWEQVAADGGTSTDCTISSDVTIGPIKFECAKLTINNDATVTLAGMVWVEGNIEMQSSAIVRLDSSLGSDSLAFIANDPDSQEVNGTIKLLNNVTFQNSGTEGSTIFLVSRNTSAENNGGKRGIEIQNNVSGDVFLYSNHGDVVIKNDVDIEGVVGWGVELQNDAVLDYDSGLANQNFDTGASGGFQIYDWREIE